MLQYVELLVALVTSSDLFQVGAGYVGTRDSRVVLGSEFI